MRQKPVASQSKKQSTWEKINTTPMSACFISLGISGIRETLQFCFFVIFATFVNTVFPNSGPLHKLRSDIFMPSCFRFQYELIALQTGSTNEVGPMIKQKRLFLWHWQQFISLHHRNNDSLLQTAINFGLSKYMAEKRLGNQAHVM